MNLDALHHLDKVRGIAVKLPGVTEASCHGTPAFYAGKKLFARLKEDGETLAIYNEEREKWMQQDPGTFYVTDHYKNYNYMLITLSRVSKAHLTTLLQHAWLKRAGKKLVAEWQAQQSK